MTAQEAIDRIAALREMTQTTGVMTNRTRNQILASLAPEVLAEVALEMKKRGMYVPVEIQTPAVNRNPNGNQRY